MAGLLDSIIGTTTPQPTAVGLDSGTQNLINSQVANSGQDPSHFSGILNQGVDKAQGNLGGVQNNLNAGTTQANTGMAPGQFQALRQSYAAQAGQNINRLKSQNDLQGQMMKADYMNQTAKALLGQAQFQSNQYQTLTNAYTQQEAARASAINSMFQTADTVIGLKAGGGFAGSGGGAQPSVGGAGSSVDQMASNSDPLYGSELGYHPSNIL